MHKNSLALKEEMFEDENVFLLFYFYTTLTVEEKIETLLYDFGGLMAAAGGNLGLCLGFSCLSILFSIIAGFSFAWKRLVYNLSKN